LPTKSGFFFGGTEYNEYYYDDIKLTIKIITPLLKELEKDKNFPEIYYHSSW
jgi:hypothetical protein